MLSCAGSEATGCKDKILQCRGRDVCSELYSLTAANIFLKKRKIRMCKNYFSLSALVGFFFIKKRFVFMIACCLSSHIHACTHVNVPTGTITS